MNREMIALFLLSSVFRTKKGSSSFQLFTLKADRRTEFSQNRNFLEHKHATLFDVKKRIPVYSSGKFMRAPGRNDIRIFLKQKIGIEENGRPASNWHHLALGLCLENTTDISSIRTRSFYSNIDSVAKKHQEFCSEFQALGGVPSLQKKNVGEFKHVTLLYQKQFQIVLDRFSNGLHGASLSTWLQQWPNKGNSSSDQSMVSIESGTYLFRVKNYRK